MKDIIKVLTKAVNKNGGIFAQMCIADGVVEVNNGRVSILANVPELAGITATVPADKFMHAIRACRQDIDIKLTKSNLIIKSGAFSARIGLNTGEFPRMDYASGDAVTVPTRFPEKLAIAATFATSDIFNGVLLREESIYGVSNAGAIALDGVAVPADIVLPIETVADIVSIKEQPIGMRVSKDAAVVEYASFKLRTALVDKKWPDASQFLTFDREKLTPVTDDLRTAVDTVLPFVDQTKRVTFTGKALTGGEATVDGILLPESAFNGEALANALKYAAAINIDTTSTTLIQFTGDGVVGVLAGMKI